MDLQLDSKGKEITPEEKIERLTRERDEFERAYHMLRGAIEIAMEMIVFARIQDYSIDDRAIERALDIALASAETEVAESAHPADVIECPYCERCNSFLSESSEQAGYCLKCATR